MVRRSAIGVILAAMVLFSCGSASSAGPVQRTASPTAKLSGGPPAHIAILILENEEYSDIIGSSSAPYINLLAQRYSIQRSAHAITHPSLPNYLALTGGSTFGIHSDCTGCHVNATSIVDQLENAHISWKAYMEDLPHSCFKGASSGNYAKKHDPFLYYSGIRDDQSRCSRVVPLARLGQDERNHSLPRFIWITPNLCHDMHNCSVSTGDHYLSRLVPPLLNSLGRRGLLFLVWDEGTSDRGCCKLAAGGHVPAIVAGPGAVRGGQMTRPTDHYSVLQTVEDLLGLPRMRGAACPCTPSLAPLLK